MTVPAAPGSALASLRARREAAVEALHLDLPVPRLDPPVFVRFAPIEAGRYEAIMRRTERSKDPERHLLANAALIAECCRGVWERDDAGEPVSVDPDDRGGEWPRFDDRLAGLLGLDSTRAVDVVRGLYLTDGDLIATAVRLGEWSGYATQSLDEDPAGN